MLDYQDFKSAVSELEAFYGGVILNGGILEAAWYETLKHLRLPQLQTAIARCFKKHPRKYNFFPAADDILEFAQGEYCPPGERGIQDFTGPALPSHEARMTPEQIAEAEKRGRLIARIIVDSTGYMSLERKEELIEQLKSKPTHELEAITSVAAQSQSTRKRGVNNIAGTLKTLEQDFARKSVVGDADLIKSSRGGFPCSRYGRRHAIC